MCFNEPVGVEKLKGQIINSDLILQTLYLCLDNEIFLNKICVCAVVHICLESEIQLKQKFAIMVQIVSHWLYHYNLYFYIKQYICVHCFFLIHKTSVQIQILWIPHWKICKSCLITSYSKDVAKIGVQYNNAFKYFYIRRAVKTFKASL
jgi:hypothetical protein